MAPRLIKLGARLHMQSGAGDAVALPDAAFADVAFGTDRNALSAINDVLERLAFGKVASRVILEYASAPASDDTRAAEKQPALASR